MADKRLQMPLSCAQVVIKYDMDGQPVENVFYVEHKHRDSGVSDLVAANFNSDNATWVASLVKTWLAGTWAGIAHSRVEATEVDIIWNTVVGDGPLDGRVFQDSDYPIVGSNGGTALPNNVTVAIELKTDHLGRSFHGRQYVVGLCSGQYDVDTPNQLKAASLVDLPAAYNELRTKLADFEFKTLDIPDAVNDTFAMQVMSYVGGPGSTTAAPIHRSPALNTTVTNCILSDPYLDSMRRRLPGHNRHH